jgi:hypothetical protein
MILYLRLCYRRAKAPDVHDFRAKKRRPAAARYETASDLCDECVPRMRRGARAKGVHGPTLKYDPSLSRGKRVGHPKMQQQIPRASALVMTALIPQL